MLSAPALAATQIELPVSPAIIIAGVIALAIPGVIGAAKGILDIVSFFRVRPPLHDVFATKTELSRLAERLESLASDGDESSALIEGRLSARVSEIESKLERRLEHLDSRLESIAHQLSTQSSALAELRGEVRSMGKS